MIVKFFSIFVYLLIASLNVMACPLCWDNSRWQEFDFSQTNRPKKAEDTSENKDIETSPTPQKEEICKAESKSKECEEKNRKK